MIMRLIALILLLIAPAWPVWAGSVYVQSCDSLSEEPFIKFTIKGNTPSITETNRMVPLMLDTWGCTSFDKINFDPVYCPWSRGMFEPCRPYHELKFKKCQLREYKEIKNMDEETARETRYVADEICYLEAIK